MGGLVGGEKLLNAVVVCVDDVMASAKAEGYCIFWLMVMIRRLPLFDDCSDLCVCHFRDVHVIRALAERHKRFKLAAEDRAIKLKHFAAVVDEV